MENSEIVIRHSCSDDLETLTGLMRQLYAHYWPDQPADDARACAAAQRLISGPTGCSTLIAWRDGRPSGFATYALLHPSVTEHGTFFMKDLFVADTARGSGLGARLMRKLAELAVEYGCHRFDWTAESDNPGAIGFYDHIGAARVGEKVYFRLCGADLRRFAAPSAQSS